MFRISLLILLCLSSTYIRCQEEGVYTTYSYDNGQISSEGILKNGRPDGYWKTYYEDGTLKTEGNRKDYLLDSVWNFYTAAGNLKEVIDYKQGKRNGWSTRFANTLIVERCQYVNDTIQGICEEFLEGVLIREVPFDQGRQQGKGYDFDEKGTIIGLLTFKDGFLRDNRRINRKDKIARKQGLWMTFYEERTVHTEGTYVDDLEHGLFKVYSEDGELISLEKYENGELVDDASETVIVDIRNEYFQGGKIKSSGSYKEGVKHGIHRDYDQEGNIISSRVYSYGKEIGSGIIGRSGRYEGPWKELYDDGTTKIEGTYTEGLRTDKWTYYHRDGKVIQTGKYRKGKPHGPWKWYYSDGSLRREEEYRNGREDGQSVEYDKNGTVLSKGEYIDGLKEGEWEYFIGDHVIKGSYKGGEKDGDWIGRYTNGKLQFKGEFVSGFAKGKHKFFYSTGQLMQDGKYSSGRKDGDWRRFDEEGEIILRSTFQSGIERRLEGVKISPTYEELEID